MNKITLLSTCLFWGLTARALPTQEQLSPMQKIFMAATTGNEILAQKAITQACQYADKDTILNLQEDYGYTPLHIAVAKGHVKLIKFLLAQGANTQHKAHNGYTALHTAAAHDHAHIAQLLIEHGANKNAQDNFCYTPLHIAAACGHTHVAQQLITNRANSDMRAHNGYTPVHIAILNNQTETTTLLVENKANINALAASNCSPLHLALKGGKIDLIELLINSGSKLFFDKDLFDYNDTTIDTTVAATRLTQRVLGHDYFDHPAV